MTERKLFMGPPAGQYSEQRRASDAPPVRLRTKAEGLEAHSNWMNRDEKAAAARPADRHSAITRGLYNWTSYKTWADRVRTSWETDKDGKDGK